MMIDGLKYDQAHRFAGKKMVIRAAYSGDAEAGAIWQAELQTAFPGMSIGLDPLPISISCHTGDGAWRRNNERYFLKRKKRKAGKVI